MTGAAAAPVLFCADPLRPRRPDEHYAGEAAAVRAAGGTVGLIDHDALVGGDATAAVARVPEGLGPAWYRGWMIPGHRYRELAGALAARGGGLLVAPDEYQRAHELPGWYEAVREATPRSVWLPCRPGQVPSVDEVAALVAPLGAGPGIVKDFVKSRKHDWREACYLPELTDVPAVRRVVRRFVELQGEDLAGGVVVRVFETFRTTGPDGGEARVWWLDGRAVLTGPHPDTPHLRPRPDLEAGGLAAIGPLVARLRCRFVTTDLARRADGVWRIVEVGDGQVSDVPRTGSDGHAADLMRALVGAGQSLLPPSASPRTK